MDQSDPLEERFTYPNPRELVNGPTLWHDSTRKVVTYLLPEGVWLNYLESYPTQLGDRDLPPGIVTHLMGGLTYHLLPSRVVMDPKTLWRGVYVLPPQRVVMDVSPGVIHARGYWLTYATPPPFWGRGLEVGQVTLSSWWGGYLTYLPPNLSSGGVGSKWSPGRSVHPLPRVSDDYKGDLWPTPGSADLPTPDTIYGKNDGYNMVTLAVRGVTGLSFRWRNRQKYRVQQMLSENELKS